jgi:hypothetical protein
VVKVKRQPEASPVSVEIKGTIYTGYYRLDRQSITVRGHGVVGSKTSQIGGSPPETIARMLLLELITESGLH